MKDGTLKIALHGATGRMGGAVLNLCRETGDRIVGATAEPGCDDIGRDLGDVHGLSTYGIEVSSDVASALLGADVIVDFSHARAVVPLVRAAKRAGIPLVSGTTGLDEDTVAALDDLARNVPVLWAPNFSLGIQVLVEVVRHATKRLGTAFDIEIVETHHRRKVDAPSGTAARLLREIQDAAERPLSMCSGREGHVGARPTDAVGLMALRGGDVVGDHTVHLMGPGERLELTHRATSREVFARGALFAAHALTNRPPGRLSLADVLA